MLLFIRWTQYTFHFTSDVYEITCLTSNVFWTCMRYHHWVGTNSGRWCSYCQIKWNNSPDWEIRTYCWSAFETYNAQKAELPQKAMQVAFGRSLDVYPGQNDHDILAAEDLTDLVGHCWLWQKDSTIYVDDPSDLRQYSCRSTNYITDFDCPIFLTTVVYIIP